MMLTIVSPDFFIREAKRWGISQDSLIRVRTMKKGEFVYCRFSIPNTSEMIQTRIRVQDWESFGYMELSPISIPAVYDETDGARNLEDIKRGLDDLNANTSITNSSYSLWSRQPVIK